MEEIISKYFDLTPIQEKQFALLYDLYEEWNNQINVISRKDFEHFYVKHVLHSLAIAKVIQFKPGTKVLDIGTGGGFPGIPLAILFPDTHFHLVDSIGKKIKVVQEVAMALDLENVEATHERAEKIKGQYDFIVSRAVTRLINFMPWTKGKFSGVQKNSLKNGILYLKGGDIHEELNEPNLKFKPTLYKIPDFFEEDFFDTKLVVYIPMTK